jgi:hypothetical protein
MNRYSADRDVVSSGASQDGHSSCHFLPAESRVRKTTVAARFANIEVEIRGAPARKLRDRLWDDDVRSPTDNERGALVSTTGRVGLTEVKLFKTEAFLESQPFGNVPAAFGPDGQVDIFESNSIMRAAVRLGRSSSRSMAPAPTRPHGSMVSRREPDLCPRLADLSFSFVRWLGDRGHSGAGKRGVRDLCIGGGWALSTGHKALVADHISLADISLRASWPCS